jgi:uncharacterized membrane protein
MTQESQDRWLLFLVQLPTRPAAPRIKLWRRLQQLGSIALRGSVYVLPNTASAREDFEWLRSEVLAAGGQASIMAARALSDEEDEVIAKTFRDARSEDYQRLTNDVQGIAKGSSLTPSARRAAEKALRGARQELSRIEAIDFGGSPHRDAAVAAMTALAGRIDRGRRKEAMPSTASLTPADYRGRTWITRPRPGVDRMSSAWLIRRFIDPRAKFAFDPAKPSTASRQVPFDMFGVEFGHDGDRCTFEVLAHRFGIDDPAVRRLGEIVHDVDLKEDRYGHPESPVVNELVEGLRRAHADDHQLLEHGITMFGGLYESFRAGDAARGARKAARKPARAR